MKKEKTPAKGKKKKKAVGHRLMDELVAKARSMGAVTPLPAGLPGQKTIVKV